MNNAKSLLKGIREKIECILIKNYDTAILTEEEQLDIKALSKEFSKNGKAAFDLLIKHLEEAILDKDLFYLKVAEITGNDFFNVLIQTQSFINVYAYVAEYEKYIQLTNQYELAEHIMALTQKSQLINLNDDLLQSYTYRRISDNYNNLSYLENTYADMEYETFKTGVEFLDTAFNGGLQVGQLVLVSGDYEAGKTTLCTQMLENMSKDYKVCFFCFEFTIGNYIQRRGKYPNPNLNKDNMFVITDGYDIQDIKSNIETLHEREGVKIFLIDSQMRIENNLCKNGNGEEKESEKFEILGKLSHRLNIIIMLIILTCKQDENTPFKSKKGAHEASVIMHLARPENEKVKPGNKLHKRLLKVKKNKQTGKHFKEIVIFNESTGFFEKEKVHYQQPNSEYEQFKAMSLNDDTDF